VLTALRGEPPASQQQLAAAVGIEGPTLTRHLDQLEAAGLVRRAPHPGDRRAVQVELTPRGVALHGELLEVVIAFNRRLTAGLSDTELDAVRTGLAALEANIRPG
jgi:MarR family transcriptional regulator for hemolysin